MKIIDQPLVGKVYESMISFDIETLSDNSEYTMRNLSAFDHRLTNEEAEDKVLFFTYALEREKDLEGKEYFKNHDKFLNFYLSLYSSYRLYGYFTSNGPDALIEFDNIEEYKSHILLSVRQQLFLTLILPDLFTVIKGGFDLTHQIYVVKGKEEYLGKLEPLIKRSGLHIL
jgi:hypothetical protein